MSVKKSHTNKDSLLAKELRSNSLPEPIGVRPVDLLASSPLNDGQNLEYDARLNKSTDSQRSPLFPASPVEDEDLKQLFLPSKAQVNQPKSKVNKKFHKFFPTISQDEIAINSFSCALVKEILIHGCLYVSYNWFCFHSKIFNYETKVQISVSDVIAITKERTAFVMPNAVGIRTTEQKYVFGSLFSRDGTYKLLNSVWNYKTAGEEPIQTPPKIQVDDTTCPEIQETESSGSKSEDASKQVRKKAKIVSRQQYQKTVETDSEEEMQSTTSDMTYLNNAENLSKASSEHAAGKTPENSQQEHFASREILSPGNSVSSSGITKKSPEGKSLNSPTSNNEHLLIHNFHLPKDNNENSAKLLNDSDSRALAVNSPGDITESHSLGSNSLHTSTRGEPTGLSSSANNTGLAGFNMLNSPALSLSEERLLILVLSLISFILTCSAAFLMHRILLTLTAPSTLSTYSSTQQLFPTCSQDNHFCHLQQMYAYNNALYWNELEKLEKMLEESVRAIKQMQHSMESLSQSLRTSHQHHQVILDNLLRSYPSSTPQPHTDQSGS